MALKVLCQANGLTEWKVVNSLSLAAGRPEEAEPGRDHRPGGGGVARRPRERHPGVLRQLSKSQRA
jgi:hypothetical protein